MFKCVILGLPRRVFGHSVGRYTATSYRYYSSGGKGWNFSPSNRLSRMADSKSIASASLPGGEHVVAQDAGTTVQQNPVSISISTTTSNIQNVTPSLKSTNPLVWIDCEMTGLTPPQDKLLQIACYITDSQLTLLEPIGFEVVISRPQSLLSQMDDWCTATHTSTGLIPRVLSSTTTVEEASTQLLSYIQKYVPDKKTAIMCGNSIHFDKLFLSIEMPEVVDWLSYRVGDVSSIKEFARRWCDEAVLEGLPVKKYTHEAREDILESIEEARYYRRVLFRGGDFKV
ncbi:hypothetical protein TWF506_010498 [Arthrobotrys conoides]|uniref:Exonuclease domain-containing protein n=1 Tax=Arthrobotrys conoides TaxID=74498 RepID=A0AAN8N8T8_9PEZI